MINFNRKNIFIILIIIAVVIIAVAGVFIVRHYNSLIPGDESINVKEWSIYQNEKYGYAVKYPKEWPLDYSELSGAALQIIGPKQEVLVIVSTADDNRLTKKGGYELVMEDIENAFARDLKIKVDFFERLPSNNKFLVGGYSARGTISGNEGRTFRFKEFGFFTSSGRAFSIIANIESDKTDKYGDVADEIIKSFDPLWHPKEE